MPTQHTARLAALPTWLLAQASTEAHRVLVRGLTDVGSTGYEYRVLASLGDNGELSQADIGRYSGLDRRDVTHTTRRLEQGGLVVRRSHPDDARQVLVSLTPRGEDELGRLDAVIERVQDEVFSRLTNQQRETLVRLLDALLET